MKNRSVLFAGLQNGWTLESWNKNLGLVPESILRKEYELIALTRKEVKSELAAFNNVSLGNINQYNNYLILLANTKQSMICIRSELGRRYMKAHNIAPKNATKAGLLSKIANKFKKGE